VRRRDPPLIQPSDLVILLSLGILAGLFGFAIIFYNNAHEAEWRVADKTSEHVSYLLYTPDGLEQGKKYPLVFALSPNADPMSMIIAWADTAEKHKWLIAASKEFEVGLDFPTALRLVEAELNDVEKQFPVDRQRVIFSGFSGSSTGAHAFVRAYPGRVWAMVLNSGAMADGSLTAGYPPGKLAVLLASRTDPAYAEIARDRQFLESRQWKVQWIEFEGGKALAPAATYEQAAEWLEENAR